MDSFDPDDMVVLADAARELGVSVATLYRTLAREGIQTFRKLGDRRAYLRREDVERLRGFRPRDLGKEAA